MELCSSMLARRMAAGILPIFLASCASTVVPHRAAPTRAVDTAALASAVTTIADEAVQQGLLYWPTLATLGGIGSDHSRLPDRSAAARAAWESQHEQWEARLGSIDPEALWGRPEWVTHGFLEQHFAAHRADRHCKSDLWGVNQLSGWQVSFANVAARQPVGTPTAREQALTRWRSLPVFVESEIGNLREGIRLGYTAPRASVERVIEQLDQLSGDDVTSSPFFAPARQDTSAEFRSSWQALMISHVVPAVRRYHDYLRDEYLQVARSDMGVSALPDGEACYRAMIRASTGLNLSAEEVYKAGIRESAERLKAFVRLGEQIYGTADPALIRERIRNDTSLLFASRDEVLRFSEAAVGRAKEAMPRWFRLLPQADVGIEPVPAYQERSRSSSYLRASDDGSRPATFVVNLYQPEQFYRGDAESLAFHETYPGHHVQIGIAGERTGAHMITRYAGNSGFVEGWATYAEILADEMSLYSSDTTRLVLYSRMSLGPMIDPGIHVLGWTRQQAIDSALALMVTARPHIAEAVVDRVAVWPAQAISYDLGRQEILRLREQARSALGVRFDIKDFHDRVLEDGSITLPMLRRKIERWINQELANR